MSTQVYLSPIFNGWQFLTDQGVILAGGLVSTYVAGSTTPAPTYTDASGTVQNSNPIQLNSAGRPPQEIWLPRGQQTKFLVTDSLGNPITPNIYDYIEGLNDPTYTSGTIAQWLSGYTPSYTNVTTFTVPGNVTPVLTPGRRCQFTVTAGTVYGSIKTSVFAAGITTVVMNMDGGQALDSGLSNVNYSLLTSLVKALPVMVATTAGGDAYTATVGIASYNVGDEYRLRFNAANTGTGPTIALDGLAAISITDNAGNAPAVGAIVVNGEYTLRYTSAGTAEIIGGLTLPSSLVPIGAMIIWPSGLTLPAGYIGIPYALTSLAIGAVGSAYHALYVALGAASSPWGSADGFATTFYLPWITPGYAITQAAGIYPIATQYVGAVLNHVHPMSNYYINVQTAASGIASTQSGAAGTYSTLANTGGAAANYGAGAGMTFGIRYI